MHQEEKKQATIKLDITREKRSWERWVKKQRVKNYLLYQKAFKEIM
jgi:hypothetical protein